MARVPSGWQALEPCLDPAMETWNTGKGSLIRRGIREVKNSLQAKWNWQLQARIPMKIGPGKLPAFAFRRIHARLIGGCPEVSSSPQLRECVLDSG